MGLALHGAGLFTSRPGWTADLSRRRNRHVYKRGRTARRGFALSLGNVVTGGGGAAGLATALITDRRRIWSVVETFAYYDNPFEYWAYRKDRYWPPRGAHPRFVWPPRPPP